MTEVLYGVWCMAFQVEESTCPPTQTPQIYVYIYIYMYIIYLSDKLPHLQSRFGFVPGCTGKGLLACPRCPLQQG